jgi:ubiquinone/menaquinone biosynthesis C-methylase UbiE
MPIDHAGDYRFGYSPDEIERLGNQHRVWAEDNQRLLARAGFGEGATLVDLGCGPGYTTLDLARAVGPQGRVIAGISNVEARTADLEVFDLPEDSVDGVYGRWVLMYLPEKAVEVLTGRVARWLRPSGICVLAEICNYRHLYIHPPP